jgi:hypothetical protein
MSSEAFVASGLASPHPAQDAPVDPRLAKLPLLLRLLTRPGATPKDVREFMKTLVAVDDELFGGAHLFLSRDRRLFILIDETLPQTGSQRAKGWNRWPLRRLFAPRRSCVITNPVTRARALAVPFTTASEDYVVVATLRTSNPSPAQAAFLEAFEALVVDSEQPAVHSESALDGIELNENNDASTFLAFGLEGAILDRVRNLSEALGWDVLEATTLGRVMQALEEGEADVVLLQTTNLSDSLRLRSLRLLADAFNVPIVHIAEVEPAAEITALSDANLDANASPDELVRTLKRMLQLIPLRRRDALAYAAKSSGLRFSRCTEYEDFALEVASAVSDIAAEWCAVRIVDETGRLYGAEFPQRSSPLMETLPSTFLSGEVIVRFDVDDAFFHDVSEGDETQRRLRGLQPRSGALLPIYDDGTVSGTIVALCISKRWTQAEAEALLTLADVASASLSVLRHDLARREARSSADWAAWKTSSLGNVHLVAYRGRNAQSYATVAEFGAYAAAAIVSGADQSAALLLSEQIAAEIGAQLAASVEPAKAVQAAASQFDVENAAMLAAALDANGMLTYVCEGYPEPVQIPLTGPSSVLHLAPERRASVVAIRTDTVTLLYGLDVATRVDSAELVTALQRQQRLGRANPCEIIPELSGNSGAVSFVAITRPQDAL